LTTEIDYEAAEAGHPRIDRQFDTQYRDHSLPSRVVIAQAEGMSDAFCGYLFSMFSMASDTIDSFDPLNILELIDFLLTPCFSIT
jgi:hypothetical protein